MTPDERAAMERVAEAATGAVPVPVPEPDPIDAAFARGLRGGES